VAQARSRLAGQVLDGATRLVSLHDGDARPIRKGRIDRPVEFGYKAQVIDNDDGIVVDYGVQAGNPPRRSLHLVRTRSIHPQPGQDQRPRQLTRSSRRTAFRHAAGRGQPTDFFRTK